MRQQLIESAARFGYEVLMRLAEILVGVGQPSPSPPVELPLAETSPRAIASSPERGKNGKVAAR